jgi:CRP-like cAMP-binding protein
MKESKLKAVRMFAGIPRRELRRLSTVTDEVIVPTGTRLIDEGTFAHEFLLIEAGTADVRRRGELVARLGPGDFAGEIGVIRDANGPRAALVSSWLAAAGERCSESSDPTIWGLCSNGTNDEEGPWPLKSATAL